MARGRVYYLYLETPPVQNLRPVSVVHTRAFGSTKVVQNIQPGSQRDSGYKWPRTVATTGVVGGQSWDAQPIGQNAQMALYEDDIQYYRTLLSSGQVSNYLVPTNFMMSVKEPILGLEVELVLETIPANADITVQFHSTLGGAGGTPLGTAKLIDSPATGTHVLGGPTDTWGIPGGSLTEANIEAETSGLRIQAIAQGVSSEVRIDRVLVKVYYQSGVVVHARAIGTALVSNVNPVIRPPSVIHNRALPNTHSLLPGPVTVQPTPTVHPRAFGNPTIHHTVKPIGVVHPRAFGTTSLTAGGVTVSPSSVVRTRAFGNPTVALPGGWSERGPSVIPQ